MNSSELYSFVSCFSLLSAAFHIQFRPHFHYLTTDLSLSCSPSMKCPLIIPLSPHLPNTKPELEKNNWFHIYYQRKIIQFHRCVPVYILWFLMSSALSLLTEQSFRVIADSHYPEKLLQTLSSIVLSTQSLSFKFNKNRSNRNAQLSATNIVIFFPIY